MTPAPTVTPAADTTRAPQPTDPEDILDAFVTHVAHGCLGLALVCALATVATTVLVHPLAGLAVAMAWVPMAWVYGVAASAIEAVLRCRCSL